MMKKQAVTSTFLIAGLLLFSSLSLADTPRYEFTISNHVFTPSEIVIPANTKVILIVHNKDNGVEEFHSDSLHREKIIGANQVGKIKIGPLPPGEYSFMGEFHASTAQGRVIVK